MTDRSNARHQALMERALRVVPGGVYGHGAAVPPDHPRFFQSGRGCRVCDVDGHEYIDFMCSYGPNLLGFHHPRVEAAADRQRQLGNCFTGPTERWVELAELLVEKIRHADWAMFTKNGTDATTLCLTIARAATQRRKVLVASGAYHGAAPWCTPSTAGVIPEDRAQLLYYTFNDTESVVKAAAEAAGDLAGILVSPFKHDVFCDQELVDPDFARTLRRICDEQEAALMIDEVRAGLRMAVGGSWESIGVEPDLSAWGKSIANGHPISAVVGAERLREAAMSIYATGSFWYSAVPMAAAIETIRTVEEEAVVPHLVAMGQQLRDGLDAQASSHGLSIRQTGPPQMPQILFDEDPEYKKGVLWTTAALERGVYLHPFHNMFLCAAHGPDDIKEALEGTNEAFARVRREFGRD
ncbi:MAG: aminotransferase class III-fold pyridoxal phosphate-dependent enzyme [Myxococcota bacterium]|nr:aminotransferase class III-fold pyridoxal phosphate-dependent enzyme [Myxococcota bacterium]